MWYSEAFGVIKTPREMTIGGIRYPRQIFRKWSKPELAELGIRPARMDVVDQRYYNTGGENYTLMGNEWVISYTGTPRDVETLKEQRIDTIKSQVAGHLKSSDWMIIREEEGYKDIAGDWKTWRGAIRDHGNALEEEIADITGLDGMKEWDAKDKEWPNDPNYVEPEEE